MWEDILQLAYANGLWAVLFLGLFIYQLSDSAKREQKYYDIIENLSNSLKVVENINEKVDDIEHKISHFNFSSKEKPKKVFEATSEIIEQDLKKEQYEQ